VVAECSLDDLLWSIDGVDNLSHVLAGQSDWQAIDVQNSDVPTEASSSVYLELCESIDPSLLLREVHEPRVQDHISDVLQSIEVSFAKNSPSQNNLLGAFVIDSQLSNSNGLAVISSEPSASSDSPDTVSSSLIPNRSSYNTEDDLIIKRRIERTRLNLTCQVCEESFTSPLRYRRHIERRQCRAPSSCSECGVRFKHARDLRRHQGLDGSVASCSQLRGSNTHVERFTCTCEKTYTRKDSLQRHIKREGLPGHKCRNCQSCICTC